MYYQTQVKNSKAGSITDVNGKTLYLIGNFDCQEGDSVWTDGQFVFGQTPARSTPFVFTDNQGIPVSFDSAGGYIKLNGRFKAKDISSADWIVNTDRIFENGNDAENAETIDTEINNNGDLVTVTNGFYRFKSAPTFHNHLYTQTYRAISENESRYRIISEVTPYVGQLFDYPAKSFADIPVENTPVILNQEEINLKSYADMAETFALAAKNNIMQNSNKENNAVNWTRQPAPPDDFIALSYAAVVGFHVSRNGDWDAIISTAAMGICFPYLTFDGSIFDRAFPNDEDKTFSEDLVKCINNFEDVVFNLQSLPFEPTFEQYEEFDGTEKDYNDEYTPEFKEYILDKVEYYIPLARFRYYYWFPIIFSACKILHVHNGEVTGTIYQSHGGGNVVIAPDVWDEKEEKNSAAEVTFDDFVYNYSEAEDAEGKGKYLPLDEDYYCEFSPISIWEVYGTKDGTFSLSDNIYVAEDLGGYEAYGEYQGYYYSLLDSEATNIATQNNISVDNLYGRAIFTPALSYHFEGLSNDSYLDNPYKINYPYMSGWFKNPDEDNDDAVISYCFAKLKNGDFLLGARGGSLYRVGSDGTYKLGSGLKNFRLRELKNINKAKK